MDTATIYSVLTLLGIIVAIVGIPWYLRGKLAKLETRLSKLETGYKNVATAINGLLNLLGTTIGLFHSRKALTDSEFSDILKNYTEMAQVPETAGTPLTQEELARLDYYLAKAHRGDFFFTEEVLDYNDLVATLEREKRGDPSVWPFVALGAFLLGLFLASKK